MNTIFVFDVIGTFVFAISGVMAAVERKFDLFGAIILGFVTAVGGGTMRDVLIGATPVGWMNNDLYVWIILSSIPVAYFFSKILRLLRTTFLMFDTIGIGVFTILGIEKSLAIGLSPLVALMMGVVSAVFGGVLRDVLSGQVPLIFRHEIYAFACVFGGVVYLTFKHFGAQPELSLVVSILTVITMRLMAIRKGWSIPFAPLKW
ncbi:MAG: trimeric intracellular cation channel family protein [Crocinitomicaceae bacterium]|nr:trimeric intracellular cation channel family protein [Crocinitomicaceae bacterium]